jgi:hypothetical protein
VTVRTWITVSVAVLIALSIAIVVQFLRPVPPPAIVVRADDIRLEGVLEEACWPQRNGELRCTEDGERPAENTIDDNGSFRFVFAYPADPREGRLEVARADGTSVLSTDEWKRTLRYALDPGRYVLTAQAGTSGEAFVRYVFALRVTRSGS